MIRRLIGLALCALALPAAAQQASQELTETQELLAAAIAGEHRSDADRARDRNRKPLETLTFFGLEKDMKVLELLPGGGWYTKILAPALADDGKLYLAIGASRVDLSKMPEVEVLEVDAPFTPTENFGIFSLGEFSFDAEPLDMILTFRNLHNLDAASRAAMNSAAFDALKSGGIYGVIDHTRRHMAPFTTEVWRRLDPVQVIKEAEAAGFIFEDYSNLHYRPDDELRYEVSRKSVTGNSDRFTLKFRKP
jgi:predicted methyltransferase